MSVNENMEFENINQKVKERAESVEEVQQTVAYTYREVKVRRQAKAIASMIVVAFVLSGVMAGFWGLSEIMQ